MTQKATNIKYSTLLIISCVRHISSLTFEIYKPKFLGILYEWEEPVWPITHGGTYTDGMDGGVPYLCALQQSFSWRTPSRCNVTNSITFPLDRLRAWITSVTWYWLNIANNSPLLCHVETTFTCWTWLSQHGSACLLLIHCCAVIARWIVHVFCKMDLHY